MRDILLLEPPYRNKYPPIGLMKISAYHKQLGDKITFYKGTMGDLCIDKSVNDIIKFYINNSTLLNQTREIIRQYITKGNPQHLESLLILLNNDPSNQHEALSKLKLYRKAFTSKRFHEVFFWDRIYVTTLFTFYWDITIKSIQEARKYIFDEKDFYIGGVMASLIPEEIEKETGLKPITGLLDAPGILDNNNEIIIDDIVPDYLILDQVDYKYPAKESYITFMTKGCTRTCSFCAVPKIEPNYKDQIPTLMKMDSIRKLYGDKKHLLLMDNNVLASPKFLNIIDEIKEMGFDNNSRYRYPNQFEIYCNNLNTNFDSKSYLYSIYKYLQDFKSEVKRKGKSESYTIYCNAIIDHKLHDHLVITKEGVLEAFPILNPIIEKCRNKAYGKRFVDFNQGTDARYITDEIMKNMATIPIRPLRIAFDYLGMKKQYISAVELAAKHGLKELSNYLLYNFTDKPIELWERMKINIDLSKNLGINIFSFPMKYIPLYGEEAKNRHHIGKHWNRKFIRSVQVILNVTKGIVASGDVFFHRAFGSSPNEFISILHMPNKYIMYRETFGKSGLLKLWENQLKEMTEEDKKIILPIIYKDDFINLDTSSYSDNIKDFLLHYTVQHSNELYKDQESYIKVRDKYNELVNQDIFLDMTLTYDFDNKYLENLGEELSYMV